MIKKVTHKNIYIFIDTNIYLNYFRMSSETITSLEELKNLLIKKDLELVLPRQVIDEYTRENKERLIDQEKNKLISQIKKELPKLDEAILPLSVRHLIEAKRAERYCLKLKESSDNLIKKCCEEFENRRRNKEKIDKLIKNIFKRVDRESIEKEEYLMQRAFYRYLKGNPPGDPLIEDKEKYGDAIIWEWLLSKFSKSEDRRESTLVIITNDRGWYEDNNKQRLNEFLRKELEEKTYLRHKISNSLGDFINKITRKTTIKKEVVEEEKILKEHYPSLSDTVSGVYDSGLVSAGVYIPQTITPSSSISFIGRKYICPFCNKDITIELKNEFPGLGAPLWDPGSMASINIFPGSVREVKCPYCNNSFNLNNI